MLEQVQIREPARVYDLYPHEVSGGMGQRVMIAMMLIAEPEVLIADEPTSALDVTVQLQILKILDDLVTERGMGLIFISHDLHLVQSFCDRVIVMYGGKVMETLPAAELADPAARSRRHPYPLGLLERLPEEAAVAVPALGLQPALDRLKTILIPPGEAPPGSLRARVQPLLESALTEKAMTNFFNDIVAFYLIKTHWDLITKRWLQNPLAYSNAWLTVFYLVFLLVRYRKT